MDRTAPVWMGNIEGREDLSTSSTASSASISSWIEAVSKIVMIPFWEATAQISRADFSWSAPRSKKRSHFREMYIFGDDIHAPPLILVNFTVDRGGLVFSRSRARKESRSECIKHSKLCPTRKQHSNMRGVSNYQKGVYMYHFLGFGFNPRAKDENIRTTRWRECSTEATELSQSACVFPGRLPRMRRL